MVPNGQITAHECIAPKYDTLKHDSQKHHRRSIRLKRYDYSQIVGGDHKGRPHKTETTSVRAMHSAAKLW
ncbi:MAG TPA: hypothetical protein ENH09_00600 [Bacteroidetes bacterium]|nr:hypothetical protein [Bacteroidota bacterium]